jgi:hypothetical protein
MSEAAGTMSNTGAIVFILIAFGMFMGFLLCGLGGGGNHE